MKTKEQVESEFKSDLKDLLAKHAAEIMVVDRGDPYSGNSVMEITINSVWSEDGKQEREFAQFDLGCWIDWEN